ncbi:MAG: DUF7313 family protein [Halobacteriota archaeon]
MEPSSMLGPIDLLAPVIEYIVLALVVANLVTRHFQHRHHRQEFEADAEALTRHPAHFATNVALVLASLYFLSLHYHGGVVLTTLVLGLVIVDLFEFESREVELRNDRELELPKAAIAASGLVLLYAIYISVFFVVEPVWRLVFA